MKVETEALIEELARAICYNSVHWGDAERVVKSRVDAEWRSYIGDVQIILPIITRRDQETWNRAIEASARAASMCNKGIDAAMAIASLKDNGHG